MSHALTEKTSREFLAAPTVSRFKAVQTLVFTSNDYDPSATALRAIEARLPMDSPVELIQELNQLPCSYQICPRFHYVKARTRESLGEVHEMQEAISHLRSCLAAIVATGDGSKQSPFEATFITDEDDVVRSFGERVRYQQVLSIEDRSLDVVTAHSGVEFWFDVTRLMERNAALHAELANTHQV